MQSTEFLITVNDHFGLPFDRVTKLATALRKAGHYPDGRSGGHVSATQAAMLLSLLAINPNPYSDEVDNVIRRLEHLRNDNEFFIHSFAKLLAHSGEGLYIQGVTRIALSLDRDLALIVSKNPAFVEALTESTVENYVTKESEILFGDATPRKVERFVFLKKSLLLELASALSDTGHDFLDSDLTQREKILDQINNV
jgi:hypothetical protein